MRPKRNVRLGILVILGACIWISLVGRLFAIQVLHRREYRLRGKDQHQCKLPLEAQRGNIYDRDGVKLVFNLPVKSYYAVPREVDDPQRLARLLSPVLDRPARTIAQSLNKGSSFVWIARQMSPWESELIESWSLAGVYPRQEMERFYPGGSLGCQVLGFTDVDNKGLEGLELYFDEELRGRDGWTIMQRDAYGRMIPLAEYPREEPSNGHSLVLTLHASYQAIAEQELEKGIQSTQARAGCVILMDPKTGEILALANEPRCDLNDPGRVPPEKRRNRAVTDIFEPGSTFKIVAAAAALEEGLQRPDDLIYCEGGKIKVCHKVIHDVEEFGWLTFQQVIEKSSNVGIIKVASKLDKKRFYDYARRFGFGNMTGIDLPGEVKGRLAHPKTYSGLSLASMAIGHEVAVTPLQLICAYAAVANGGTLRQPYVVRYVIDERGNTIKEFSPVTVRRVISPETAATLRSFLAKVVEGGTGKPAAVQGIAVAGKTGTAFKLKEDGSGFSTRKFIASFCGFFPADSPRLVGLVVLDEPRSPHSGGKAAAPVFRRIVEHIMHMPKGPCADLRAASPELVDTTQMVVVPELFGLDRSSALDLLQRKGLLASPSGDGSRVCHHEPGAGALVPRGQRVKLDLCAGYTSQKTASRIPHVVGLTLREAIRQFQQRGLAVEVSGSGLVTRQTPKAGYPATDGVKCLLECEPPGKEKALMAAVPASAHGGSKR